MTEVTTDSLIYLILVFFLIFFLYEKGKKRYEQYISVLDKKKYPLKDFLPIGFLAMEYLHYSYTTQLDRNLRKDLKELYEEEYVEFYLRVQWALIATYCLIGIFFSALLYLIMNGDITGIFAGIGLGVLIAFFSYFDIINQVKKRHLLVAMDLPDLTNKLLILSGAGLSLQAAIIKVAKEMKAETPLYIELEHCVKLMENGTTAEVALERLCIKCNMPEIRRFVAVIIQNLYRGGSDVLLALQDIGKELWENRRAAAKRIAEEAGTKLLFPMMLMLLAVILMVAVPALMTLNI